MFGSKKQMSLIRNRIDEMNKVLGALDRMGRRTPATERKKLVSQIKRCRVQLQDTADLMKNHVTEAETRLLKLSNAGAASWSAFRTALAKSHKAFSRANRQAGKAVRRAVR